jgi:hypothetical protein
MKRKIQKMQLSRETLRQLDGLSLEKLVGGVSATNCPTVNNMGCTDTCPSHISCRAVCTGACPQ